VPYYQTPADQSNVLVSGATVVFQGNYTFIDANTNGMSDAWETNFFGTVSTNRTKFTDSDGDGVSDYKEFMAGTDPTSAASRPQITAITPLGSNSYRLFWTSSSGRGYRVHGSTNLVDWTPVSGWTQATLGTTTFAVPPVTGPRRFFRVEVQP
jgi:hypothetical protein